MNLLIYSAIFFVIGMISIPLGKALLKSGKALLKIKISFFGPFHLDLSCFTPFTFYLTWAAILLLRMNNGVKLDCICPRAPIMDDLLPTSSQLSYCSLNSFSVFVNGTSLGTPNQTHYFRENIDTKYYHSHYTSLSTHLFILALSFMIPKIFSLVYVKYPFAKLSDAIFDGEIKIAKSKIKYSNLAIRQIVCEALILICSVGRILFFEFLLNGNFLVGGFPSVFGRSLSVSDFFGSSTVCYIGVGSGSEKWHCEFDCNLPHNSLNRDAILYAWGIEIILILSSSLKIVNNLFFVFSKRIRLNKIEQKIELHIESNSFVNYKELCSETFKMYFITTNLITYIENELQYTKDKAFFVSKLELFLKNFVKDQKTKMNSIV